MPHPASGGRQRIRARALRRLAGNFKIAWGPLWLRTTVYLIAFFAGIYVISVSLDALKSAVG